MSTHRPCQRSSHRVPPLGGLLIAVWLSLPWAFSAGASERATPPPEHLKFFENSIRPLLVERCQKCHGADKQQGDLRLDSIASILAGGESGPAVVPGKPAESLLIEAINYESFEMPPTGKLSSEEITLLSRWVELGAPWPAEEAAHHVRSGPKITDEDRAFWSFQPVRRPPVPRVDDGGWARNDIDRFIFDRLQSEGLAPAPEADRATLARRAYFDLIGLPPTPDQLDEFLADDSPTAFEDLVDLLLESPHYGERWARHWLDLVRYAESDGFRQDAYRPEAWRYRQYVIESLNDDKPYDRFVMEQLAGDEIAPDDHEALIATGFLRHGIYEYNQRDVRTQWSDILNEVTDVTGEVFLGMGMGCARCHDHKFDPILRADYYRLQAFFAPILLDDGPLPGDADHRKRQAEWEEKTAAIRARIEAIEKPARAAAARSSINKFPHDIRAMLLKERSERMPLEHQLAELAYRQVLPDVQNIGSKLKGADKEKWEALQKELSKFDSIKPKAQPVALTVRDTGPAAPPVHIPGRRGVETIPPGFLSVLDERPAAIDPLPDVPHSTGRRSALARWITRPDHPLTYRVAVNRIWKYHFGRGLVATTSDFGHLGERPSHPELLDWLASEFVDRGASFKQMHRLIVNSATWQQAACGAGSPNCRHETHEAALLKDPDNRLLWRADVRRLDAEQIRDAALAATGELKLSAGGPGSDTSSGRRSIYMKVIRNTRDPLLDVFDLPEAFASTPDRNITTTPTQALLLINGKWMLERAAALSRRLDKVAHDAERIKLAYRLVLGRAPADDELEELLAFLDEQLRRIASPSQAPQDGPLADHMPATGSQAAVIQTAGRQDRLVVPDADVFPSGDFTVEATVLLRSIDDGSRVRVIASQWDSNNQHPGWSLGVTGKRSKHQPRHLILQLAGDPAKEGAPYEVIESNLHLDLNRPYYVAVSIKIADTSEQGITFTLADLSGNDPHQVSNAAHKVVKHYRSRVPLVVGNRAGQGGHGWDGLIDDVRISSAALAQDQLLVNSEQTRSTTVGFWRFEDTPGFEKDSSPHGNHIQPQQPATQAGRKSRSAAWIDFCHVLLNSNEFLYLD